MKKKILIFGATGLLGSQLNYLIDKKNYKVFGVGFSKKTCDYNFDVNNLLKTTKVIKKIKPDVVINCIAYTDVDKCNIEIKTAFEKNIFSVYNIVNSLIKINKKIHLVHISTDQVYNDQKSKNVETNFNLLNNYGLTKFIGEKQIKNYKYSTIIRTNFFCNSLRGKKLSYSDWIKKNLIKKKVIKIPNNVYFNPIHVKFLNSIIQIIIQKKVYGTYNVGSKNGTSKYKFAKLLAKKFKFRSNNIKSFKNVEEIHLKPQGTIMCTSKIQKKLRIKIPNLSKSIGLLY